MPQPHLAMSRRAVMCIPQSITPKADLARARSHPSEGLKEMSSPRGVLAGHPSIGAALRAPRQPETAPAASDEGDLSGSRTGRVALVFGREEAGLFQEEVEICDATCSIPMGRLQESMSLSHAVNIVLWQLFQARLTDDDAHDGAHEC
ncbi:hypothetical protein CYMTET_29773 [Cymbomonas tetramitiformis]|uniref:tRNA/rRNA methyltransferase SpoU type domain-containing protein n=1 Tax=Cymbomonas tetramitiformis TaxID=36881 RepID=A0AAE0KUL6_9CHLO|nr:hypothetical protein CYMTET_29773 [Cymbomonas tetramitiformis]